MLNRDSGKERDVYVQEHTRSEAFEHLAVSVAQLTLDGKLLTANEHMCELVGQPKRALLEKNLGEFFVPEESWPEYNRGLDRLISGEISCFSTDMRAVRADANVVWVNMVLSWPAKMLPTGRGA